MVCRLCLKHSEDLIYIFDATGQRHNMAEVVCKYFWFELKTNDPISTNMCRHCWLKLSDFHEFYAMVENAQRQLPDVDIVKTENNKCDLEDEFVELGEVPINMFDNVSNESGGNNSTDTFDSNVPCDVLLINEIKSDNEDEDEIIHHDDSDNEESSIKTTFKKNIAKSKKSKDFDENKPIACFQNKTMKLTRNCNLKKPDEKCSSGDIKTIKRKRGRPKTRDCKPRKPIKTKEEQDSYKAKMKEYDDQIAQYMSLYCDVCNTEAYNFPALRVHMRDVHSIKDGYITCCDKKFNKRALLVYHIRHHLNPDCYRCEECNFTFADRQSMHNHFLVKHQKDEDKLYECSDCPKKFSRKYLLEQHNAFSHRGRILKCKNCNKRFKTSEELTEHNKDDCSSGTMCDICAKVIRGTAAFKRHQLEHQGVTIPKEQCDLCGLWYKDSRGLKRHRRRHMESKEPHACNVCQKISPSRSAMLSHKRYAHGTERVYECSICKKNFKKPISLREHMTTHTGEILYSCPHCPKTFNSNANMHSHRKKLHPREFEETRKLRKQNNYVNNGQQIATAITVLANEVKKETEAGEKGTF